MTTLAYYSSSDAAATDVMEAALFRRSNLVVLDTLTDWRKCRLLYRRHGQSTCVGEDHEDYPSAVARLEAIATSDTLHDTVVFDVFDVKSTAANFEIFHPDSEARRRVRLLDFGDCVDLGDRVKLEVFVSGCVVGGPGEERTKAGAFYMRRKDHRHPQFEETAGSDSVYWIYAHTFLCDSDDYGHDEDWAVRAVCLLDTLSKRVVIESVVE